MTNTTTTPDTATPDTATPDTAGPDTPTSDTASPVDDALTVEAVTALVDRHLAAYCEADPVRRAALVAATWQPDGRLVDPPFEAAGHEGVAGAADLVLGHYAGHVFRRTTAVDLHHEFARYGWALEAPDGTAAVTGTDVVMVADGRLAVVVGFFGDLG